jgi:hypothetical protein
VPEKLQRNIRRNFCVTVPRCGSAGMTPSLNYYGVPLNFSALAAFHHQVIWHWKRALSRRSHKAYVTWARMRRLARRWLPPVRIVHPYPDQRLCLPT